MNVLNHIPMNNNEPTATLEDWYIIGLTIYGRCYGDRKHRFHPGVLVHTSIIPALKFFQDFKEGDIVQTLNSRYLLGKKYKGIESKLKKEKK